MGPQNAPVEHTPSLLNTACVTAAVSARGAASLAHSRCHVARPALTADKEGAVGQANGRHSHQLGAPPGRASLPALLCSSCSPFNCSLTPPSLVCARTA